MAVRDVIGVETARRGIRTFCLEQGLSRHRAEELVIVVSELATNLVRYAAGGGQIAWRRVTFERRPAIEVTCTDTGPGIADLEEALREGFSSGGGLGGGLSSVQRLVDDFRIESSPEATTIHVRKYL